MKLLSFAPILPKTSGLLLAACALAPAGFGQGVLLEEDFEGYATSAIPPGWTQNAVFPTDWHIVDITPVPMCLGPHYDPINQPNVLRLSDLNQQPNGICSVRHNNIHVQTPLLSPLDRADVSIEFGYYIESVLSYGAISGVLTVSIVDGQGLGLPDLVVASSDPSVAALWTLGHDAWFKDTVVVPGDLLRDYVAQGGFKVEFNGCNCSGTSSDWAGCAIDELRIEALPRTALFCTGTAEEWATPSNPYAACPIGNESPDGAGEGCGYVDPTAPNGLRGAKMSHTGQASVSSDTLVLQVLQCPPGMTAMFFEGTSGTPGPFPFVNDGRMCLSGSIARVQVLTSDSSGFAETSVPLAPTGGIPLPTARYYQVWYRVPLALSPAATGANLSSGLIVDWTL